MGQFAAACNSVLTCPAWTITQRNAKPPINTSSAGITLCGMRRDSWSPCNRSGSRIPAATTTPQNASA